MKSIQELRRLASPAPRPQSLAWNGVTLWMGSLATSRIYALSPADLSVQWETPAPGHPFGLAAVGGELRVLCGEGPEDNRIIRRCVPQVGFDEMWQIPCPDDTGSQLGYDGSHLHVSQWYAQQLLMLGADGAVLRTIRAPHGIAGQVLVDGVYYLVSTDDEATTDYWITRVDPRPSMPLIEDVARLPFQARALAFDGHHFWTNHREAHEIVCFQLPS